MSRKRTFFVRPGQRFGRLEVLEERLRERPGKPSLWEALCRCDCGEQIAVLLQGLKGGTQSCGCTKKRGTMTEAFLATRGRARSFSVSPGDRFGKLTVMFEENEEQPDGKKLWVAHCSCECGKKTIVLVNNLKSGGVRSCGCLQRERASEANRIRATHGLSGHPHYPRWRNMMDRCYDPGGAHYKYYGDRGIAVSPEWHDVAVFIGYLETVLGPCPDGHSLDRIDNNESYKPGNLRWADAITQRQNQRRYLKE